MIKKIISCVKATASIVVMGASLLLINCEKNQLNKQFPESIEVANAQGGSNVDYVSYKEVPNIIEAIANKTGVVTTTTTKGVEYKEAYIDYNRVVKVENAEGVINYTFNVYKDDTPRNEFYNLVMPEDPLGNVLEPYVNVFVLDSDAVDAYINSNRDFNYFKGDIQAVAFNDFFSNTTMNYPDASIRGI